MNAHKKNKEHPPEPIHVSICIFVLLQIYQTPPTFNMHGQYEFSKTQYKNKPSYIMFAKSDDYSPEYSKA